MGGLQGSLFSSLRKKTTESEGSCYTYRTYEIRRQARMSFVFRSIRLLYIAFCSIILAVIYPYLKYSLPAAAVLFAAATAYGLFRFFRRRQQDQTWRKAFFLDLWDYLLIAFLVYLTGGPASIFHIAYGIPILVAAIRFNLKAGLCGLGVACMLMGLNTLAAGINPGIHLPPIYRLIYVFGTLAFCLGNVSGLVGDERALRKELYNFSITDPLTGLFHIGYARERLKEEISHCLRTGCPFSIIFIDIDNFKAVNDRYGHLTGDQVVRHIAGVFQSVVRAGDILSRYGGDEFLLLLPGAGTELAEHILQRLFQAVENNPYPVNGVPLHLGLSAGIAEFPGDGESLEQMLQVADRRMYLQKRKSRQGVKG